MALQILQFVTKPALRTIRRLSEVLPTSGFSTGYQPLPQSIPIFKQTRGTDKRRVVLLASVSACSVLLLYAFFDYNTDQHLVPKWGRYEVDSFLGPAYPLGRIVSGSEWSTFTFGSREIPAPPPEPPGSMVLTVVPPSKWIDCPAARDFIKSLPEVTFVSFQEVTGQSGEREELLWLDEWISKGTIMTTRQKPQPPVLDVVYTWVNGSSQTFQKAKDKIESKSRLTKIPDYVEDSLNRHHDWDELRYSIRSIETFFERNEKGLVKSPNPLGNITIISTIHSDDPSHPQTPLWLKQGPDNSVKVISQESLLSSPLNNTCAMDTFSSCSVEARLDRLPEVSDKFVSLSDDMFLSNQHSAADIYSPLYGLAFTFDYDWSHFTLDYPPAFGPIEHKHGELPYLYLSAYLLHVRFGWEFRSYTKHTIHPMSKSILQELRSTFPSAFELSSAQRFRGESPSIHLWFLFYWYVIERHRESLIWSYLFGVLQDDETETVNIADLRTRLSSIDTSTSFNRTSLLPEIVNMAYQNASIEPNRASRSLWSSADGPVWLSSENERDLAPRFDEKFLAKVPFEEPRQLKPCEIRPECFEFGTGQPGNVSTEVIFEKWRKDDRSCGDCMINALLRESGSIGLSSFLPSDPKKRGTALRAIHRYTHTISRVDARYGMMDSVQTVTDLTNQWIEEKPGEVCFNDHFHSQDSTEISLFAEKAKGKHALVLNLQSHPQLLELLTNALNRFL
ncbi:hypothetical protein H072_7635 [Dactylellina haptotyla CBS 200.50]|uniref:Stealth protein CR3 conserved region 3 domain-containing protein n=1 Tax=Dactylellina haptotyla (strain CBS 200.50) TaxID=1284197 RepID=S8A6M4_DACHA|nr:hypothetical protein H072_7635 [Dactylellina haptotyla CBS 200.50]